MKRKLSKVITAADLKRLAKPEKVSEARIQETCIAFMILDGWRCLTTDPKWARGLGVAEPGIPDNLFMRYRELRYVNAKAVQTLLPFTDSLWVEFKRIDGKSSENQLKWHTLERSRGGTVVVAGVDFPKTIEGYQDWYRNSGLMRRGI